MDIKTVILTSNNEAEIKIPPNAAWFQLLQLTERHLPVCELSYENTPGHWQLITTGDRIPLLSGLVGQSVQGLSRDAYVASANTRQLRVRWSGEPTNPLTISAPVAYVLSERIDAIDIPPPVAPKSWLWETTALTHDCPVNLPGATHTAKDMLMLPARLARQVVVGGMDSIAHDTGSSTYHVSVAELNRVLDDLRFTRRPIPLFQGLNYQTAANTSRCYQQHDGHLSGMQDVLRVRAWRMNDAVAIRLTRISVQLHYDPAVLSGETAMSGVVEVGNEITQQQNVGCISQNTRRMLRGGVAYAYNTSAANSLTWLCLAMVNLGKGQDLDIGWYATQAAGGPLAAATAVASAIALVGWDSILLQLRPTVALQPVSGRIRIQAGEI